MAQSTMPSLEFDKLPTCQSAPTISIFSEESGALDIDVNTGLPKLPVELPPDLFMEPPEHNVEGRRKSVTFDLDQVPVNKKRTPVTSTPPAPLKYRSSETRKSTGNFHQTLEPSRSVDGSTSPSTAHTRRGKSRHTLPLKNRSRSVFIRLQLPNQRTPPLPHRNLAILGESDSDTDIQTAPVIESSGNSPFFLYNGTARRASDSTALGDHLRLSELPAVEEGVGTPQSLPEHTAGHQMWNNVGRRSSYLYLSDTEEDDQSSQLTRTSSTTSHIGDETYITPFAQILANLHRIRSQYLTLLGLPPETRTSQTRHPASAPSPTNSPPKRLPDSVQRKLALQTLEELDWCLKKLETVDSAKSMGTMAQDKFRRILSRELSHMSGKSRSRNHVAEWVQNITGLADMDQNMVDRALDTMQDEDEADKFYLEEPRVSMSGSISHDIWARLKPDERQVRLQTVGSSKDSFGANADYCVRVPMYGITDPKMNKVAMREFMSETIDTWNVDTFHLDAISAGNPLISASYLVFKKRDFFSTFRISPHVFINFMTKIQASYLPNPYHNKIHAADVLLASNFLLSSETLEGVFTDLEVLAALVAAAIHDVGHPARTNQFLVNVQHDLAILYNDSSVLENHHLALAFKTLQDPGCDFMENFDRDQRQAFRKMVIDMVLATDMAKHFKHLGELKTLLETNKVANDGILVLDKYSDRTEVLQCMIHCADLSNPTKQDNLAAQWSHLIMEENFLQGDEEKSLGIPLNPLGDREQVSLCKCQVTFIDFIVYPLWETWAELVYPAGQLMLDNIGKTREYWNAMIDPNSPPPSSDDQEQDSSCDTDSTDRTSSQERAVEHREGNIVTFKTLKDEIETQERRMSNGPTSHDGELVNERATCTSSSELSSSVDPLFLSSDSRRRSSETSEISFPSSPVSERRSSFKTMKNFKALEETV